MTRHAFKIPIGDWSGDGHGRCDWYNASADKSIEDVQEAYFAAKEKLPKELHPEEICKRDYPSEDTLDAIEKMSDIVIEETNDIAKYVVWFINQGDETINAQIAPNDKTPSLTFYGYDKKKRHIGHIGYGLFM